jgi:hypothetical protein
MAGVCLECAFCCHQLWDEETNGVNFCPNCGCSFYLTKNENITINELSKQILELEKRIRKLEKRSE